MDIKNSLETKRNITIGERLILLLIFSNVPLYFVLKGFIKAGFNWDNVNFIRIVSITYMVILAIIIIIQIILKKQYTALIFGCHQKHSRSFNIVHKYLGLCSRCFGILIGIFMMSLLSNLKINLNLFLLGLIPLLIDGLIQKFTKISSTNFRRIVTGVLFGPALIVVTSYYYLLVGKLIMKIAEIF